MGLEAQLILTGPNSKLKFWVCILSVWCDLSYIRRSGLWLTLESGITPLTIDHEQIQSVNVSGIMSKFNQWIELNWSLKKFIIIHNFLYNSKQNIMCIIKLILIHSMKILYNYLHSYLTSITWKSLISITINIKVNKENN